MVRGFKMRQEKTYLLDEIKEKLSSSTSLLITRFENINSKEAWEFRENLSKNKAEMEVVKKRIFLRALDECGYSYTLEELKGNIAAIFVTGDPVEATKVVFGFAEATNKLEVIKGEIDKKTYSKDDMLTLSKIPSLNVLRSEFLGLLETPMSQVVSVMENLLSSLLFAIEEKKKLEEKK